MLQVPEPRTVFQHFVVIRGTNPVESLLLLANPGMLVERDMRGNATMERGLNGKIALVTGASTRIDEPVGHCLVALAPTRRN